MLRLNVTLVTGLGELSWTHCLWHLRRVLTHRRKTRILYISDFDPAGAQMPVSIARKIEFLLRRDGHDLDIRLDPIALTIEQVQRYRLPRIPIKDSDAGKKHFEDQFGEGAVELDALEAIRPGELRRIVEAAIDFYRDPTRQAWRENNAIQVEAAAQIRAVRAEVLAQHESEIAAMREAFEAMQGEIEVDQEALAAIAEGAAARSTGVFTRRVPTFDSDILDPEAAAAIEELIHDPFDERGYVLPRIGLAPKRAFPFRTDNPFPKITANVVAANGREEKIELLGDGQQFVVDGIHPDTRQPYQWPKGDLIQFARDDLPYIHAAEAQQLVDDIVRILVERFGYRLKTAAAGGNGADDGGETISWLPDLSDHDALAAYAMKMLKTSMGDGAVVNFLRDGVKSLKDVDEERRQRRLDEIPNMVRSARRKLDREAEAKAEPEAKEPEKLRKGRRPPSKKRWPHSIVGSPSKATRRCWRCSAQSPPTISLAIRCGPALSRRPRARRRKF